MRISSYAAARVGVPALTLLAYCAPIAGAQQLLLDEGIQVGDLVVFPTMGSDLEPGDDYYYVHNRARLARDATGSPAFSFLRFSELVRPGEGEETRRESDGGGILHAVVELSVDEAEVRDAENALRRLHSGARLAGPVVYRSGTFGLVSSFREEDGEWVRRIVGLGKAPVLEGSRAAISMRLTRQGSKILWESFQMPTPDVSFSFEMEVEGLRSPARVLLEADWDRIYARQAFDVGIAGTFLAAEITNEFDDLRQAGAIRLVQTGNDAVLEKAVAVAYEKLMKVMFDPIEGSDQPDLARLAEEAGQAGMLDRATRLLADARNAARTAVPDRVPSAAPAVATGTIDSVTKPVVPPSAAPGSLDSLRLAYREALLEVAAEEQRLAVLGDRQVIFQAFAALGDTELESERSAEMEEAISAALRVVPGFDEEVQDASRALVESNARADAISRSLGVLERSMALAEFMGEADPADSVTDSPARPADDATVASDDDAAPPSREAEGAAASLPTVAAVGALRLRRSRQSGTMRVNLNRYMPGVQVLPFTSNVGDLRSYLGDEQIFREVSLDQPLFRQRSVSFRLDGLDASDFVDFVNFVSVQLRRGDDTREELTIGAEDFNRSANQFFLVYGFAGEESRDEWMAYEYRAVWSFFGGLTIEQAWQRSQLEAVALAPPLRRRQVDVVADPQTLAEAQVLAVTVRLFFETPAGTRVSEVVLRPDRGIHEGVADIIVPEGDSAFEYQVVWHLRSGENRASPRWSASTPVVLVGGVPTP